MDQEPLPRRLVAPGADGAVPGVGVGGGGALVEHLIQLGLHFAAARLRDLEAEGGEWFAPLAHVGRDVLRPGELGARLGRPESVLRTIRLPLVGRDVHRAVQGGAPITLDERVVITPSRVWRYCSDRGRTRESSTAAVSDTASSMMLKLRW